MKIESIERKKVTWIKATAPKMRSVPNRIKLALAIFVIVFFSIETESVKKDLVEQRWKNVLLYFIHLKDANIRRSCYWASSGSIVGFLI